MHRENPRGGFTLIEIMVVVIIIGILASLALANYVRTVEKSRTSEAKNILGTIRTAELAYFLENGIYTTSLADLQMNSLPSAACNANYYFIYCVTGGGGSFTANAARCTAGQGGKNPPGPAAYTLTLDQNGALGGPASMI